MARKDEGSPAVPDEFPITLEEFLSEVPQAQVEMKAAFSRLARIEGLTGPRHRAEWQKLFEKFRDMPVDATWKDWSKGGR